ncbi:hypothetical protein [Cellulomonas triticagri]|uniref:Uncharacterized protein n=1 Tax=Cellulomonas triticagri TaxID=2483352 RepID=A0A3M2JQX2_9CELL|nr:hypothetical protein [Cellulomonas triticagri]RMI13145.1 hypothetical protein EBM89_05675 [Cellulomonas triticagri]
MLWVVAGFAACSVTLISMIAWWRDTESPPRGRARVVAKVVTGVTATVVALVVAVATWFVAVL